MTPPQVCRFDEDAHIPRCHAHALSSHGDICRKGLAALRATIISLEQDLTFLGASRTETGELKLDMAKHHAAHRCEAHRAIPWRLQDLNQCIPCLRTTVEEQARVMGRVLPVVKRLAQINVISGIRHLERVARELGDEAIKALSPEKEAPYWRCVHCGRKSLGHEITLATVVCECGTGMGRWEACGMTEPKEA